MADRPRISAVVNTKNAAAYLSLTLRSVVGWVDEIVVVDMASTDDTVAIARSFGARVLDHPDVGFVEPARRFAVDCAEGDWIVLLDADEVVTADLRSFLLAEIGRGTADAFVVPRRNYLLGAQMRHSGWGETDDQVLRVFRKGSVVFPDAIHGGIAVEPDRRITSVPAGAGLALLHFNYLDVDDFVARLNRYTTVEATQRWSEKPPSLAMTLARAANQFLRRFVSRRGYRDGWRGLHLSLLMGAYEVVVGAKARLLAEGLTADAVRDTYRRIAEDAIGGPGGLALCEVDVPTEAPAQP